MAELLIRAGAQDAVLIQKMLSAGPRQFHPDRVVVDAHVARSEPGIGLAARAAGVPFIVDPQTFYLQDVQHPADRWAQLPYADALASTPADLLGRWRLEALVAGVVDHQLAAGATAVVAPYVHIERADDGWSQVQVALWRATRRHLDQHGLSLPVLAVMGLGWRLLDRATWPDVLAPLRGALDVLAPSEVALAASKVDAGANPGDRLASFIAVIRRLARHYPVIAWQQGSLGEAAVAAGATGYECGIGWRERCDLRAAMASHRRASAGGSARPVYITTLKRGIPKASVRTLVNHQGIAAGLICLDSSCCPVGRRSLLADSRAHAIRARLHGLELVTQADQPAWRWNLLAREAAAGIDLVNRINAAADRTTGLQRVDGAALRAIFAVAEHRRQTLRRHRAA